MLYKASDHFDPQTVFLFFRALNSLKQYVFLLFVVPQPHSTSAKLKRKATFGHKPCLGWLTTLEVSRKLV